MKNWKTDIEQGKGIAFWAACVLGAAAFYGLIWLMLAVGIMFGY